ncbi:Phorbol ester/diacylglycerol-binding protein unc-13 [Papilio machaon]|uniref:Phorbol ester/diacylglycerol-binding protein unc-13 n=1 Tax=Papilio machaon TaxID=76193 RepID=A0A194RDV4_PAPMA|nr:Phorbol ester/diacylglycerol-binding protein unc-13 [Papilio machaon]
MLLSILSIAATQFNTYVTLKLQNVKSTTVTVKGPTPCWEQDFLFEINDINLGLLVEVWNKGVIWDRALGYHYLPLTSVAYNEECGGRWIELEAQLMMRGGAVVGTTGPTGHALLLDCRFELPFDAEGTAGADLQRKLDMLNGALDAERAEQARRQLQYVAHSGYSEDSDYTSDLNYPVGQHANCSASQFRSAAHQIHTPQRSLEASRENSYEREEYHMHGDTDPLYYNSQPRTNRIETWSQMHAQASVESAYSWRTATDWQSGEEQRRPSLERQNTLYDDNMGYGYDVYTTSTHIRDHSHLSHQPSYEEYYDSSSYPYGSYEARPWGSRYLFDDGYGLTSTEYENIVNKRRSSVVQLPQLPTKQPSYEEYYDSSSYPYGSYEARPWGSRYLFDDGYGLTSTEYENIVNKRRSSVVQLPQLPTKQFPPSSRYSDYNEMAPYRPRPRRTAASLPATPSSTPKRGRALPLPPGSEHGGTRRGRRLPRPPRASRLPPAPAVPAPLPQPAPIVASVAPVVPVVTTHTHVPYTQESERAVPDVSYDYNTYGYQSQYQDTAIEQYQDTNYNASYDDEGMQPFFDETPHATPPAATAQKSTWGETETTTQLSYTVKSDVDTITSKTVTTTVNYLPQPPVTKQDSYLSKSYQQCDLPYESQQQYNYEIQDQGYKEDSNYLETKTDYQYQQPYESSYQDNLTQSQQYEQQSEQQTYRSQFEEKQYDQQTYEQDQYEKGSLMAGGAKKLGSFFGAAAAAVAPPSLSQPTTTVQATTTSVSQMTPTVAPSTPFSSTTTPVITSVPEVPKSVTVTAATTTSTPVLPRTPSLRRQESIQRPSVRRTRTLPDAPEDFAQTSFDESAYEEEYQKTELDQSIDRDRTSLDRYHDEEFMHDTIQEEIDTETHAPEVSSPSLKKTASPTRTLSQIRKPSVDSYHSQAPSIPDRKTSQSSVQIEDKFLVPTTQEEAISDKSKVTFQDERTTYHEVPEEFDTFQTSRDSFDDHGSEYQDEEQSFHDRDDAFREEPEKFEEEQFNEVDEAYNEDDTVFQEDEEREKAEQLDFQPEQPKLTPKQRWHRAYNKIVMQLNWPAPPAESRDALNPITSLVQLTCSELYITYQTILRSVSKKLRTS